MYSLKNNDPNISEDLMDKLHVESKFIEKTYNLITKNIEPPFALSIDGDWGTGKTFIMRLLEKQFNNDKCKYPTFWFNPWEYKQTNNVVFSFLQQLANNFESKEKVRLEQVGNFIQLLCLSGIDVAARFLTNGALSTTTIKENEEILKDDIKDWVKYRDLILEIKNEFIILCNKICSHYAGKPLIIFLDDFDRCLPDDTIQILEAIKNLFCTVNTNGERANTIFICGINTNIARNFIIQHYHLGNDEDEYSLNYFRKIFNLSINIPRSIELKSLIQYQFKDLGLEPEIGENGFDCVEFLITEMDRQRNQSIRKYQNVIYRYYTIIRLNNISLLHEKYISFLLATTRELYFNCYQELKIYALKYPNFTFKQFIENSGLIINSVSKDIEKDHLSRFFELVRSSDDKPRDYFCNYFI